jgi:hypothetical protein
VLFKIIKGLTNESQRNARSINIFEAHEFKAVTNELLMAKQNIDIFDYSKKHLNS